MSGGPWKKPAATKALAKGRIRQRRRYGQLKREHKKDVKKFLRLLKEAMKKPEFWNE